MNGAPSFLSQDVYKLISALAGKLGKLCLTFCSMLRRWLLSVAGKWITISTPIKSLILQSHNVLPPKILEYNVFPTKIFKYKNSM